MCMCWEALPGKVEQAVGVAHNYDELVDSPAEIGIFRQSEFQQDGATYHVVVDGDPADYDMAKLDELLGRITHAAVDWMQDRPYDEYTFLLHLPHGPGGGGMEHAYGTALEVNAERLHESLLPLAEFKRARVFPFVECEADSASVVGTNRLPARERYPRPLVQRRRNQHGGEPIAGARRVDR